MIGFSEEKSHFQCLIHQIYENSKIMEIPGLFRQKAVAGHAIITVKQRFAVIYCTIRGKATKT